MDNKAYATSEWNSNPHEYVKNIIRDYDNYLIEVEFTDIYNPKCPALSSFFTIAIIEDGEFIYHEMYNKDMSDQKVIRFSKINC